MAVTTMASLRYEAGTEPQPKPSTAVAAAQEDLRSRRFGVASDVRTGTTAVAGFDLGDREYGTAQEAIAMVRGARQFQRRHGTQVLIAEVFLAHGNNPRVLGLGPKSKDVDGKLFVQDMVREARAHDGAWIDYKWAHPVTNEIFTKATYVQRVGDVLVGFGVYKA